ncbi:MAG: Glu/Leu/Phe/Val family dehydrogenase [Aulosira sp. ZfuVER01]|nr:Glu/Leu/Phe/Val dehydrogenase [Aulosira sp. ZfuVER01]MDZ8002384.1 Glu/Leu/Phe/Val dehydrogenase [Aulosira sp. DedVER01a]MDZ8052533.1 Glu/Leu/Phe/Val dehydrogenase [Aulosira sp. ZfuCHP01]
MMSDTSHKPIVTLQPDRQRMQLSESIFQFADDLGPAKIIHIYEPTTGLKAIVVVDNIACGPAIGGVRMAVDVTTAEVFRLARAMTLKNATSELPHGGGKSAILADPKLPLAEKEKLVRTFAQSIRDITDYIPGPDMGTDERCMAWVKEEIGRAVGLPRQLGGIPLDEVGATGYGLRVCAEIASNFCNFNLDGARVVIQGFGSVGKHVARFLAEKGAILIGAADSQGTLFNPQGIEVEELIALKNAGRSVINYPNGEKLAKDAVIDIKCDIWIPAARPDVIHTDNVSRLQTQLVLQGANIPFTEAAENICHQRNILVIPDFIANAGGVICGAVEYRGGSLADAFQTISEKIRHNTTVVLEKVAQTGMLPRQVAMELAKQRACAVSK